MLVVRELGAPANPDSGAGARNARNGRNVRSGSVGRDVELRVPEEGPSQGARGAKKCSLCEKWMRLRSLVLEPVREL